MIKANEEVAWISTGEAASLLGVTSQTIRRYVRDRLLQSFTLPSGDIRVKRSEVLTWVGDAAKN
jgi:excisionase family DNA binding protein